MSGILIGGGSDCDCYNNQIFDGKGDGIDVFGQGTMNIYNNLIVRAGKSFQPNDPSESRHGIFIGNSPDQQVSDNILIHNTIISPKSTGIRYFNAYTSYNLIANNIITNPGAYDIIGYKAYFDHQLAESLYEEITNIYAQESAPLNFMDLQADNYDLKANSIAVNTASDLGSYNPQFDNLMRPRPHNEGYDRGAFESQDPYASIHSEHIPINKQLEISPLPAKDFVWIKFENASENMQLKLFNQFGVCVYSEKIFHLISFEAPISSPSENIHKARISYIYWRKDFISRETNYPTMSLIQQIKKHVPLSFGIAVRKEFLNAKGLFYRGKQFECKLCGHNYRKFLDGGFDLPVIDELQIIGGGRRISTICPGCHSNDRERLLHLYLEQNPAIFKQKSILHIAPEPALGRYLQKHTKNYIGGVKYYEGFYYPPNVQLLDIFSADFSGRSF